MRYRSVNATALCPYGKQKPRLNRKLFKVSRQRLFRVCALGLLKLTKW